MKILAMLNFYADEPVMLSRAVQSAVASGATNILAVDGPYENFSHSGFVTSSSHCAAAISSAGVPVAWTWTDHPWAGDEVGKRKFMLERALGLTTDDDWLMVLDADYEWNAHPRVLREALERTELDVAMVSYTEHGGPPFVPARLLFRARRGLQMGRNHYTYIHPTGDRSDVLCRASSEEALDLQRDVRLYHRYRERDEDRRSKQAAYYEIRDTEGLERA